MVAIAHGDPEGHFDTRLNPKTYRTAAWHGQRRRGRLLTGQAASGQAQLQLHGGQRTQRELRRSNSRIVHFRLALLLENLSQAILEAATVPSDAPAVHILSQRRIHFYALQVLTDGRA
eukprot:Skav221170  [mRNA]  locus=scaffold85:519113:525694:- [translate_table: standard]